MEADSVVRKFRTTAADGKDYDVDHYNLDMVLALGFRVRSQVGVRFRQWANDKLKDYIIKGFVPVSYTHLDVYKRQSLPREGHAACVDSGYAPESMIDGTEDRSSDPRRPATSSEAGRALRPSRFPLLLLRHLELTSSVPSDSTGERQSCSSFTPEYPVSKVPSLVHQMCG